MMYQLTQASQIPKDKGIRHFLQPQITKEGMVALEGAVWIHWRRESSIQIPVPTHLEIDTSNG